ncbi:MAG: acetoin utilization protein AcuC [Actinomycetota bacterium]
MSRDVALVLCSDARIYDHGPGHPLRPDRVLLTWKLIEASGLDRLPNVRKVNCRAATDEELGLVHSRDFIDATKRAGSGERGDWTEFGYGPGDNPIFPRMHEAGALVAGGTIVACDEVWSGRSDHAFNAAGGLHHAMPSRASGFCVYDDPAVGIAWLLEHGCERVAYVDVDVHHGDGPQAIFYEDPRVLTISLHQSGATLFPGTGFEDETGAGAGRGTAVNIPFWPGAGDAEWLERFREVVPKRVREFEPQVLFTQLGCDSHATDPLAMLNLTTRAYSETAKALHELAHSLPEGRWVATGGGGYEWARVVPRAWTIYFAEMCGAELPDELPESWVEEAEARLGAPVPRRLSE